MNKLMLIVVYLQKIVSASKGILCMRDFIMYTMKYFVSFCVVFLSVAGVMSAFGQEDDTPVSGKRTKKSFTTTTCGWGVDLSAVPETCPDNDDGQIRIKITGSVAPYDHFIVTLNGAYQPWDDTNSDLLIISAVSAGTYDVKVTDSNSECKIEETIEVDEPTLIITLIDQKNLCPGTTQTGTITIATSVDNQPKTEAWYWSHSVHTSGNYQGIQPTNTKALEEGMYKIVLTDGAGCTTFYETEIYKLQPFAGTPQVENILCHKDNSGMITINNLDGGTIINGVHNGDYMFGLRDSGGTIYTGSDNPITGLPAGEFILRIGESDPASARCYIEMAVTIDSTDLKKNPPVVNPFDVTDCKDGKDGRINIRMSNPTGVYAWICVAPDGTEQRGDFVLNPPLLPLPAARVDSLAAGDYRVVVYETSDPSCISDTLAVTIGTPGPMTASPTYAPQPYCIGRFDGMATVTIQKGVAPFTINKVLSSPWYAANPDTLVYPTGPVGNGFTIEHITGGTYEVVISDSKSCTDTVLLEMEVLHEDAAVIDLTPLDPVCADGITELGKVKIDIVQPLLPGTWTFTYFVNGTDSVTIADRSYTIKNLTPSTYEMAARIITSSGNPDEEGCLDTATVTINALEQPEITPLDEQKPSCVGKNDGLFQFSVTASAPNYQYLLTDKDESDPPVIPVIPGNKWLDGTSGTGTIKVDTVTIRYEMTGPYEGQFSGLASAYYYLWVLDKTSDCRWLKYPLDMTVEQELTLGLDTILHVKDLRACVVEFDIKLTVGGEGEAPYTYEMRKPFSIVQPADSIFINVAEGDSEFRVTDNRGCSIDTAYHLVFPKKVHIAILDSSTLICNQDTGHIRLTDLNGGNNRYNYQWKQDDNVIAESELLDGVMAGKYTAHVTDSTGICAVDTLFDLEAKHYVISEIKERYGKNVFCPDELFVLDGKISYSLPPTRDTVEIAGFDANVSAKWHWTLVTEDSLNFFPEKSLSRKAVEGNVRLKASYAFGDGVTCTSSDTFAITVKSVPVLSFLSEDSIIRIPENDIFRLETEASGFAEDGIVWTSSPTRYADELLEFPDPQPQALLISPQHPDRRYLVKLTLTAPVDENGNAGCSVSDSVYVDTAFEFFIPNAFTPNGDGVHNEWKFYPMDDYRRFYTVSVVIFNRSGVAVYESKDYGNDFDGRSGGKDLPVGTYYYVVKLIDKKHQAPDEVFTGSVTIIR
ncbi:MAG: gliding motility-associated C-terminal domain-containing protein [Bacteroidales bacterium]|jgi:gliding motility-associated-like protein|nr:gliding motility-associated C-terminal domain-containing protein [Bacteroidales bacterium]